MTHKIRFDHTKSAGGTPCQDGAQTVEHLERMGGAAERAAQAPQFDRRSLK